ncbi:hypothetical protein HN858_00330 [Candidatus Falkowbacteria bacterium]|jgi:hypothetical protein|nr:hypothetical protein [Candidatus Falkowbacteria bacterium]MBT6574475.1 hypothetical protein [Candidatus Falkowbacteria bacterium]MBT7348099.1 hypothetical protein [Candidatus Falkowbacteria bacterium]MBT7500742.1 hypothetical protein [Candidatus Falkowbacteria bacterium]
MLSSISGFTWKNYLAILVGVVITTGLTVGGNAYLFPGIDNILRYILIAIVLAIGIISTFALAMNSCMGIDNYRVMGWSIFFAITAGVLGLIYSNLMIHGFSGLFFCFGDLFLGGIGGLFLAFFGMRMLRPMAIAIRRRKEG